MFTKCPFPLHSCTCQYTKCLMIIRNWRRSNAKRNDHLGFYATQWYSGRGWKMKNGHRQSRNHGNQCDRELATNHCREKAAITEITRSIMKKLTMGRTILKNVAINQIILKDQFMKHVLLCLNSAMFECNI